MFLDHGEHIPDGCAILASLHVGYLGIQIRVKVLSPTETPVFGKRDRYVFSVGAMRP